MYAWAASVAEACNSYSGWSKGVLSASDEVSRRVFVIRQAGVAGLNVLSFFIF